MYHKQCGCVWGGGGTQETVKKYCTFAEVGVTFVKGRLPQTSLNAEDGKMALSSDIGVDTYISTHGEMVSLRFRTTRVQIPRIIFICMIYLAKKTGLLPQTSVEFRWIPFSIHSSSTAVRTGCLCCHYCCACCLWRSLCVCMCVRACAFVLLNTLYLCR